MIPASVLARWSRFRDADIRPFGTGLINKTFLVEKSGDRAIFQRLHPVFAGTVNEDIDVVTRHLENKGLVTPKVLAADDGSLFVNEDSVDAGGAEPRPWRALSFVNGRSFDRVGDANRAREGGALVARFHAAVADLDYDYHHVRAGVHDTQKHLATLEKAVTSHKGHRLFSVVEPLAQQILDAGRKLPDLSSLPLRNCHGDLKISNLLFTDDGKGLCLVDLDTLGRMIWPFEMGDALRSWCNPAGEDVDNATIDVAIFEAALQGYGSVTTSLTQAEKDHLVDGLFTICVELSSRFLADALNESYFGWNQQKFATRGDHNLLRARGQWALASSVEKNRARLERAVAALG
jgi:Ser/Thr protein kinase RdoA (MazF antagonist)